MSATVHPATTTPSLRRRALGVAAAVLAPALIWLVGAIAGVDYTVENPGQPAFVVGLAPVVLFALAAALVGWVGLVILERLFRRQATVIWTALAVVLALLSLVPVVAIEATAGAKVVLGLTHLAVAAALIGYLPARSRGPRARRRAGPGEHGSHRDRRGPRMPPTGGGAAGNRLTRL